MVFADRLLLVMAAGGAILLLQGCAESSPTPTLPPKPTKKTTVIVMRHCIRSTSDGGIDAMDGYTKYDHYAPQPWPTFDAPDFQCLRRGEKIVEAQGRHCRSGNGSFPLPLYAIADKVEGERDNVTMHYFLKGLAIDPQMLTTSLDDTIFNPAKTIACEKKRLDSPTLQKQLADFINASPPPPGYHEKMQRLYEILGKGAAGNWIDVPCNASHAGWDPELAEPAGACQAASEIVERMLMNWGGGLEIAWGNTDAKELASLMVLHDWEFNKWWAFPPIYQWQSATIIRDIVARFKKAEEGTTLYVGHDTDITMIAGAFGLSWTAPPFAENATLPGSMLRFDLESDTVSASYHYVGSFDDGDPLGAMMTSPALFSDTRSNHISLSAFEALGHEGTIEECAFKYESEIEPQMTFALLNAIAV